MFSHLTISYMTGCLMCTQWLCLFQVTGTDIAVIETTGITRTYISKMTYKASNLGHTDLEEIMICASVVNTQTHIGWEGRLGR